MNFTFASEFSNSFFLPELASLILSSVLSYWLLN